MRSFISATMLDEINLVLYNALEIGAASVVLQQQQQSRFNADGQLCSLRGREILHEKERARRPAGLPRLQINIPIPA
jgi:hypothetical protein